jgi:hypothetical protein
MSQGGLLNLFERLHKLRHLGSQGKTPSSQILWRLPARRPFLKSALDRVIGPTASMRKAVRTPDRA